MGFVAFRLLENPCEYRVRELTGRCQGISMDHRLSQLRSYVRGSMGYFGLASQLELFDRLDQWLRRRIRMCYWKQWRRLKRRREMLIQLGVPRRQAIRHARSRKGPWHMAKTITKKCITRNCGGAFSFRTVRG